MTTLNGVAAVYGEPTAIDVSGKMWEEIDHGAFAESIRERRVIAFLQHDHSGQPLGRQANDTLRLDDRRDGLHFALDLPNTSLGRDVEELVKRRDIAGVSFGFIPQQESVYRTPDGRNVFVVERAVLIEISPVALPAYPQTDVTVGRATDPDLLLARLERQRLAWSAPSMKRHRLPQRVDAAKRHVTVPLLTAEVAV